MPLRRTPVVATLVALCLLLAGLAPSVSRVLAETRSPSHDLCVADAASSDLPTSRPPAGHHPPGDDAACALCAAHGGSHGAPPPTGSVVAASRDPERARMPRDTRVSDARPGLAAAPRGPPGTVAPA